uniref:Uncharacterized protein n=1 Tax=Ciona intestinalis TaxID=7719 RepID=H2XRZ2_CIOIN
MTKETNSKSFVFVRSFNNTSNSNHISTITPISPTRSSKLCVFIPEEKRSSVSPSS